MHEGDRLSISPQGELIFHDAFKGENHTLLNARGELQMGAIEEVKKGIPEASSLSPAEQPVASTAEEVKAVSAYDQGAVEHPEETLHTSPPSSEGVTTLGEMAAQPIMGSEPAAPAIASDTIIGRSLEDRLSNSPSNTETGSTPFSNVNNVRITPDQAAVYSWQLPNTDVRFPVAWGADMNEAAVVAEQQALASRGDVILYPVEKVNDLGVSRVVMYGIVADENGVLDRITDQELRNPVTGASFTAAEPNDFVRRISP